MPGGYRDTVTRGWARPVREVRCRASLKQGEKARSLPINISAHVATDRWRDVRHDV